MRILLLLLVLSLPTSDPTPCPSCLDEGQQCYGEED